MGATHASDCHRRLLEARLYLIASVDALGEGWEGTLEAALGTGCVDLVQLRDKTSDDAAFLERARRVRRMAAPRGVLLVLNDRVHLVEACGADGAHVGEDDLAPEAARRLLGRDRLLGLSTHDEIEVAAAAGRGADHVGLGPCFATGSKLLLRPPGGPALVRRCASAAGGLPLFPIGGVTPGNVGLLVEAGARRAAVGQGVLGAPDPAAAARAVAAVLATGRPAC
jgi:thiamine-phosphate pyrophosphorylase